MTFRVGMKVVCVDAAAGDGIWPPASEPIEGRVYTIRELGVTRVEDQPGIRLEEIIFSSSRGRVGAVTGQPFVDACYRASRFRPVVDSKTAISWTVGAPLDSSKWDNRVRAPARKRETAR